MPRPAPHWTREEHERLLELIEKRHTAEQIGRIMGRTKNSVVGYVNRKNLVLLGRKRRSS